MDTYTRAYSYFRTIKYGPYTINVMEGTETGGIPLLVSVAGPGLPRVRLTTEGPQPFGPDDEPLPEGLIVFGSHKWDRPRLGSDEAAAEPPADDRLDVRLPSDLKAWTLANGGSRLVRDLLRRARARVASATSNGGGDPGSEA